MIPIPNKIYVVHYTKLQDRLANIYPSLKVSDIPWEIITKYDREDPETYRLYKESNADFTLKIRDLWDAGQHRPRRLNDAEISCTAKHLLAIKKVSEECKDFGFILEDDAIFDPNFASLYNKCIAETPSDWDAIFLGTGCGIDFINRMIDSSKMTSFYVTDNVHRANHPATNCAEAYLIKPAIAKKIYESAIPFQLVSDWELAYQFYKFDAKVYWWKPPLVSQGSKNGKFKSELDLGQR
jgi:GR25 family glycosyltransferase involved in LPS biosynthesis